MVELAEIALQRCVDRNYETSDNIGKEITDIHYSFEFLDDFITPKPSLITFINKLKVRCTKDTVQCEVPMKAIPTVPYKEITPTEESALECEDADNWMLKTFKQEYHPLELMVCATNDFHTVVVCIT